PQHHTVRLADPGDVLAKSGAGPNRGLLWQPERGDRQQGAGTGIGVVEGGGEPAQRGEVPEPEVSLPFRCTQEEVPALQLSIQYTGDPREIGVAFVVGSVPALF